MIARVFSAQGRPSPTRMSNTLLPMELDTAMSPMPDHKEREGRVREGGSCETERYKERQADRKSEWAMRRQEGRLEVGGHSGDQWSYLSN